MPKSYITTPIYYVNDLPHIGHIYTTLVADTVARYHRMCGFETRFLTGTDEHGQKIERAAQEQGVAPIELADRVVSHYHELWARLGVSHDDFIRTSEPRHRLGVEAIIERIARKGDLYVDRHGGWYCSSCETFYTEKEIGDDKLCPDHGTALEWQEEENVFFRLSRYQDRLIEWYDRDPSPVQPGTRRNEVRSFVASGLRDLSVSRTQVAWGIPFPGYPGHTVYVWLDALTNYLSALGFGREDQSLYERFWAEGGDAQKRRLHLVGKDILRHHAVYWPAFLMSAELPLPDRVWAHGWWQRDGRKMSKSVGNVVRPHELIERFGVDSVRYFLLREMVFGQDASFSDEGFIDRFNSDLANDLGNTVSRLTKLASRHFDGATPPRPEEEPELADAARETVADYRRSMDELAFHRALEALWRLLGEANQYLVAREPWKLVKQEGALPEVAAVLWNALEATRIVACALLPIMPETAPEVLRALGCEDIPTNLEALAWGALPSGSKLPDAQGLFPRIDKAAYLAAPPAAGQEEDEAEKAGEESMITIEEFFKTELKVARVQAAERVPKSKKLLQLEVDLGSEQRTVVAGIAEHYEPEDLVGRQVVVVANLQPAKLMGVESQGMVLAASEGGIPILLSPDREVPPGTQVR